MAITVTSRGTQQYVFGGVGTTGFQSFSAPNFTAGTAILCIAYSNEGGGGADGFTSLNDTSGNTWTLLRLQIADPAGSGAGTILRIYSTPQNVSLLQNTSLSISWSRSSETLAISYYQINVGTGNSLNFIGATGASFTTATSLPTVTSPSLQVGNLIIGAVAYQHSTALTADTDTSGGSWSSQQIITSQGTLSGGGVNDAQTIASQFKILTSASTQTYNPVLGGTGSYFAIGVVYFSETTPGIFTLTADTRAFVDTFVPANTLRGYKQPYTVYALTLTRVGANFNRARGLIADRRIFTLTGVNTNLKVPNKRLFAETLNLIDTFVPANLLDNKRITIDVATITETGINADLVYSIPEFTYLSQFSSSFIATTGNATVNADAGIPNGSLLVIGYGTKPFSDTPSIDNGYLDGGSASDGTIGAGVDSGSMQTRIFYLPSKLSTTSSPTITNATNNVSMYSGILAFSYNITKTLSFQFGGGGMSTASTAFSATYTGLSLAPGDLIIGFVSIRSDAGAISNIQLSVPGVSFNSFSQTPLPATTISGGDMAMGGVITNVISGTVTNATLTFSANLAAAHTGSFYVMVVRATSLLNNYAITADSVAFVDLFFDANLNYGRKVIADARAFTLTRVAANTLLNKKIVADLRTLTVTRNAVNSVYSRSILASVRAFTLTRNANNVVRGLRITASLQTYAHTGIAANLNRGLKIPITNNALTLTRNANNLTRGYLLSASVRGAAITPSATNLLRGSVIGISSKAFNISGNATNFPRTYVVAASARAFAGSYNGTGLLAQRKITIASNAFTIVRNPNNLNKGNKLIASVGTFTASFSTTNFIRSYTMVADSRIISTSFKDAFLVYVPVNNYIITAFAKSITVFKNDAYIFRNAKVIASVYNISLISYGSNLTAQRCIKADVYNNLISSFGAKLNKGYLLTAQNYIGVVNGVDTILSSPRKIIADVRALSLSFTQTNLAKVYKLPISSASIVATSVPFNVIAVRRLVASGRSLNITPGTTTLRKISVYKIIADPTYLYPNFFDTQLRSAFRITINNKNYYITGSVTMFKKTLVIATSMGTFIVDGKEANLMIRAGIPIKVWDGEKWVTGKLRAWRGQYWKGVLRRYDGEFWQSGSL